MRSLALALALLLAAVEATPAATVSIRNGRWRLILQVGGTNATVNQVNFSVPGASVGDGTDIPASSVTPPSPTCPAGTVLIDAQARSYRWSRRTATLSADSSSPLLSAGNTIPFSQIAWTSSTPGGGPSGCLNAPTTIPSGAFNDSAGQPLLSFGTSQRACVCAQFTYLNDNLVSAGTYTGSVTYTLAMP